MSGDDNTLREDVEAAADAVTSDELVSETGETATVDDATVDLDATTDEAPDPEAEATEDESQAALTEELPPVEPLQHWPYQLREQFNKIAGMTGEGITGRDVQQLFVDSFKDFQRREMDNVRELQGAQQQLGAIDEMMRPYDQHFAMAGLDRMGGVRQLLSWATLVSQDPARGITALAQSYGLDLGKLSEGQPMVDPALQQHMQHSNQQMQSLRSELARRDRDDRQTYHQQLMNAVQAFEQETDDAGNPRFPFVEQVYNQMADMARADIEAMRMPNLESLYNEAVNHDPALRQQVIDAEVKAELARRAEKAKKAKGASKTVKGNAGTGKVKPPDRSLREDVNAAADKIYAQQGLD